MSRLSPGVNPVPLPLSHSKPQVAFSAVPPPWDSTAISCLFSKQQLVTQHLVSRSIFVTAPPPQVSLRLICGEITSWGWKGTPGGRLGFWSLSHQVSLSLESPAPSRSRNHRLIHGPKALPHLSPSCAPSGSLSLQGMEAKKQGHCHAISIDLPRTRLSRSTGVMAVSLLPC